MTDTPNTQNQGTHPPRALAPAWFSFSVDSELQSPVYARAQKMNTTDYNNMVDKLAALSRGELAGKAIPNTTLYEISHRSKNGVPHWVIYMIDETFNAAVILQVGGGNLSKNKNLDIEIAKKYQVEHGKVMAKLTKDLQDDDYIVTKIERDLGARSHEKLAFTLHVLFCLAGRIPDDNEELDRKAMRIRQWALDPRADLSAEEQATLNAWLDPIGIDLDNIPSDEAEDSVLTSNGIAFVREAILA